MPQSLGSVAGQGFLLGLSSGVSCLTSCTPVLLPLLLGTEVRVRRGFGLTLQFLLARLLGYLCFAAGAWSLGRLVAPSMKGLPALEAWVSLSLGCLMIAYGVRRWREAAPSAERLNGRHEACLVSPWSLKRRLAMWPGLLPGALGFLSGLSLCTPFLVALSKGALSPGLTESLLFFGAFFLGTSLFFLPFPLLGLTRARPGLQTVSALVALLVGLWYLYSASTQGLAVLLMHT